MTTYRIFVHDLKDDHFVASVTVPAYDMHLARHAGHAAARTQERKADKPKYRYYVKHIKEEVAT